MKEEIINSIQSKYCGDDWEKIIRLYILIKHHPHNELEDLTTKELRILSEYFSDTPKEWGYKDFLIANLKDIDNSPKVLQSTETWDLWFDFTESILESKSNLHSGLPRIYYSELSIEELEQCVKFAIEQNIIA